MSEWISVEDRLPEDGQRVAFIADIPKSSVFFYQNGQIFGGAFYGGKFPSFGYPGFSTWASYWMELPPPPL